MSRGRIAAALFWVAVAGVVVAHTVVAFDSVFDKRLWEDEAFNLTVPRNLLAGLGYSSDGTLSGSTLTPWDVRISTGPTALLPIAAVMALGADPVIGGRAVMLAFWALLLAALFLLGRRVGGRWAGLVAIAATLALDASRSDSPLQGPADILGEVPAAALIAWALVVLPRRAWLAGLLLGLAIQAKLIALLALPAFFVWLLLSVPGSAPQRVLGAFRRGWPALAAMIAPTVVYEVFAAADPRMGYLTHLRQLRHFVLSGGQTYQGTTVADKARTLLDAWWLPSTVVATLVIAAIAIAALAVWAHRDWARRTPHDPAVDGGDRTALLAAAAVGLLAFAGWWAASSHTPLWVRHPAPGLLAFTPVLSAGIVPALRVLIDSGRSLPRAIGAIGAVVAVLAISAQVGLHAAAAAPVEAALTAQRADAAAISAAIDAHDVRLDDGYLVSEPWGAPVAIVFLTGHHVGLWDARGRGDDLRVTARECERVVFQGARFRLCDPE